MLASNFRPCRSHELSTSDRKTFGIELGMLCPPSRLASLFRLRQRQIASEDDASSHNRVDCSADIGSDIGKGAAALNTLRWNNGTLGCQSIYDNMHNQARPGADSNESPSQPVVRGLSSRSLESPASSLNKLRQEEPERGLLDVRPNSHP